MTELAISADAIEVLRQHRDPAALVSTDGKLQAWNEVFSNTIKEDLIPGMDFPVHGNRINAAIKTAGGGQIGLSHTYLESQESEAAWLLLALPQTTDAVLVLLTQGEMQRAFNDDLTGLPNRRDANNRLLLEWRRMLRNDDQCFSIALVDIDHFKLVNDRYGHDIGDEALVFVAEKLKEALRAGDWVARWGGEEFLLYLHETPLDSASKVAERIRQSLAAQTFVCSTGAQFKMTACLGVVCSDSYVTMSSDSVASLASMINSADVLLYDAKLSGRNRTITQAAGEKIFWDEGELNSLISEGDISARPTLVANRAGTRIGTLWDMSIRAAGASAPARTVRSALKLNRASMLDAAWLEQVNVANQPTELGSCSFVPVTIRSLLEFDNSAELETAAATSLAAAVELIFVISDSALALEVTPGTLEMLRNRGIKLCLHITSADAIPTRILNHLSPRYALLDQVVVAQDDKWHDMLNTLTQHGVQAVVPSAHKHLDVATDVLYYGDLTD